MRILFLNGFKEENFVDYIVFVINSDVSQISPVVCDTPEVVILNVNVDGELVTDGGTDPVVTMVVAVDGVKQAMIDTVTFSGISFFGVPKMILTELFSGNWMSGRSVTLFVPGGDTRVIVSVPSDGMRITVMLLTFVSGDGTDTETTYGLMPDANGMVTDGLGSRKSTPGLFGLSALG